MFLSEGIDVSFICQDVVPNTVADVHQIGGYLTIFRREIAMARSQWVFIR